MILSLFCLILAAGFAAVVLLTDFQRAKTIWIPLVYFFAPVWVSYRYGGVDIDVRFFLFFVILFFYVLNNPLKKLVNITLPDILATLLIGSMALSQYHQGYFGPSTLPEILRKWLFPYLLGRWFLNEWRRLGVAEQGFRWVISAISVMAIFEAFSLINPVQLLLQKRFPLLELGEGYRWGIRRAMGTSGHPIFFGMAIVCAIPWSFLTAQRAFRGKIPKIWLGLPLIHLAAIFLTASRGPMLVAALVVGSSAFFGLKKWRWLTGLFGFLGILLILFWHETGLDFLGTIAGEKAQGESREVVIDGETYEYTGTVHRVLLFRVYADAIDHAGWFGFGNDYLEGMSRAGITLNPNLEQRFGSIDNGFLLLLLKHGWLAVGIFIFFTIIVLSSGFILGVCLPPQPGTFAGMISVALFGVFLGLNSVWFSADFSAIWLFHAGFLVSLGQMTYTDPSSERNPSQIGMGLTWNLPKTSGSRP